MYLQAEEIKTKHLSKPMASEFHFKHPVEFSWLQGWLGWKEFVNSLLSFNNCYFWLLAGGLHRNIKLEVHHYFGGVLLQVASSQDCNKSALEIAKISPSQHRLDTG